MSKCLEEVSNRTLWSSDNNALWKSIYFGFDFPIADIKLHCCAHHGCRSCLYEYL